MNSLPVSRIALFSCLFTSIVFLAGCGKKQAPEQQPVAVRYQVITITENVPLVTEMPGRVSAYRVSEVRPQVGGIILSRHFEEGSDVREGQVLYQIDPALYETAYNNAKAELARAESNLVAVRLMEERYSRIVDIDAVSRQEYDNAVSSRGQAEASVEAAKQAVENARINLGYTKVTAPVSGRISRSFVTPGALVTQNQPDPLTTIQQISPVYVDVTQSSTELLKLRRAFASGAIQKGTHRGAKVKLRLEDGSPYAKLASETEKKDEPEWILGELQFSDITVEQSTGVISVRATFNNPDHLLLPGMYVRAIVEEGIKSKTILIPQKTLLRDAKSQPYVYILTKDNPIQQKSVQEGGNGQPSSKSSRSLGENDFYVAMRYVTVEREYNNNWLISNGLKEGELLLVDGFQRIQPGQIVTGMRIDPSATISEQPQQALAVVPLPDDKAKLASDSKAAGTDVVFPDKKKTPTLTDRKTTVGNGTEKIRKLDTLSETTEKPVGREGKKVSPVIPVDQEQKTGEPVQIPVQSSVKKAG